MTDSDYPWEVIPDPSSGYTLIFPDGRLCMPKGIKSHRPVTPLSTDDIIGILEAEVTLGDELMAGAVAEIASLKAEIAKSQRDYAELSERVEQFRAEAEDVAEKREAELASLRQEKDDAIGAALQVEQRNYDQAQEIKALREACRVLFHRHPISDRLYIPIRSAWTTDLEVAEKTIGRLLEGER